MSDIDQSETAADIPAHIRHDVIPRVVEMLHTMADELAADDDAPDHIPAEEAKP